MTSSTSSSGSRRNDAAAPGPAPADGSGAPTSTTAGGTAGGRPGTGRNVPRAAASESAPAGLSTDDPLALANQLCFSLSVASRMVVQSYRPVLEPLGLTHPQYLVMLALWDSQPRTVKDLGEQLMQDSATLSPLLKRLEAHGYLTRERDPRNERALAVSLTEKGMALRERAMEVPTRMMERLDVSRDQVHLLNEGMHRLISAAQALGPDTGQSRPQDARDE